jgi:hypothetical protein
VGLGYLESMLGNNLAFICFRRIPGAVERVRSYQF